MQIPRREDHPTALAFKTELYRLGLSIAETFLNENFLPLPIYHNGPPPHAVNKWQATGLYVNGKIWVDLLKTSMPCFVKSRVWSWPGYKVDKTAVGVIAHETGHFIADLVRRKGDADRAKLQVFGHLIKQEKAMSGYEPVPEEAFAEAMRLYITNPDLLRCGRPKRYRFFNEVLKLEPIGGPWRDVLQSAPDHVLQAATNFAKREL